MSQNQKNTFLWKKKKKKKSTLKIIDFVVFPVWENFLQNSTEDYMICRLERVRQLMKGKFENFYDKSSKFKLNWESGGAL